MQRRACWLQSVATGSTPEALERLQAAVAAAAGWERQRFVVPAPARRPVEAPPRGSIQPFACCGSCTQACYLYGHHRRCRFDPSVAILHSSLPGRSHLTESCTGGRGQKRPRAIRSLWPLLQCQCPVTAVNPRSATQSVMPRYRFFASGSSRC